MDSVPLCVLAYFSTLTRQPHLTSDSKEQQKRCRVKLVDFNVSAIQSLSGEMVFKVWSQKHHYHHHQGTSLKCKFSGPPLDQKLWRWDPAICALTYLLGDSGTCCCLRAVLERFYIFRELDFFKCAWIFLK